MAGGYVTLRVPVNGVARDMRFWSDNGLATGVLTAAEMDSGSAPSGVAAVAGTRTTNGDSAVFTPVVGRAIWITLGGTFGGATVTVRRSVDGGLSWRGLTIAGSSFGVFTAPAQEPVAEEGDAGAQYVVTVSGATGTTSIDYRIGHN